MLKVRHHLNAVLLLFTTLTVTANAQTVSTVPISGSFRGMPTSLVSVVQGSDGSLYGTAGSAVFKMSLTGALTPVNNPMGPRNYISALVQAPSGTFYGTTGSLPGTIFKLTPAGELTTIHQFDGSDGRSPSGLILATDGNLYGTTSAGGTRNPHTAGEAGTVFKVTLTDGGFSTIHMFGLTPGEGIHPKGLVEGRDGNLYGATEVGGAANAGTIFKITPAGTLTTIHSFRGTDGRSPEAPLIQAADGSFYGTTASGGPTPPKGGEGGTLFKITSDGSFSSLYNFVNTFQHPPYSGYEPRSALLQTRDGMIYGLTHFGGQGSAGTLFRMTPQGTLTTLYEFGTATSDSGRIINDGSPVSIVQAADGNLYGTTAFRVFKFALPAQPALPASIPSATVSGGAPESGVSGKWALFRGAVTIDLHADSRTLTGSVTLDHTGGRPIPNTTEISHGEISGDIFSFDTESEFKGSKLITHYVGKLDGDTIHFVIKTGGSNGRTGNLDAHRVSAQ